MVAISERVRFHFVAGWAMLVMPLVLLSQSAVGLELEDPQTYTTKRTWTALDLDLPGDLGEGLFFDHQEDILYVVGETTGTGVAVFSLNVLRDPQTNEITALENSELVFEGDNAFRNSGLSSGWAYGPEGSLFYSYGYAKRLAQRPGGVSGAEETFPLSKTRLRTPAAAGVAFSPYMIDPNTNFGMLQLSDWTLFEHRVWNVPLMPTGDGYFEPQRSQVLVEFPGEKGWQGTSPSVAGDIEYIPSGPQEGNLLVADWNSGDINILPIDKESGLAIDRNTNLPTLGTNDPVIIPFGGVEKPWSEGNGPNAFAFDPVTNDLFVLMFTPGASSDDTIIQIGGFPPPPDIAFTFVAPGDADMNLQFDQLDLVQVQIAAKYLSGQPATWGEGDWDAAPGGRPGAPPAGDGFFDQLDIIVALASGHYLTGPYAAIQEGETAGDERISLVYDADTGMLSIDSPASKDLTSINITSTGNKFIGDKPAALDGAFDNFEAANLFKATFGGSFGDISFGNVLPAGLSEPDVTADLTVVGSLAGGGDLGTVDLVYIPEPSTFFLVILWAVGMLFDVRTKRPRVTH